MLSSKIETVMKRYADVRLIGLSQVSFQRLKVLIARIFQVVKSVCFTSVEKVRNFVRVISGKKYFSKFCELQNYSKLFVILETNLECFPSSKM